MGCNIHLHIEIKINDKWEHFGCPYMPRDYQLYGKMAGVRDESETPLSKPKGIPEDITLITKLDYDREHKHNTSWFNIEEIEQLMKWFDARAKNIREFQEPKFYNEYYMFMEQMTGYLFGNAFYKMKVCDTEIQDIRFVFWFDN